MQSESGDLGRSRVRKVVESGELAPNTARLTACGAGDIVADGEKRYLNFLFVFLFGACDIAGKRKSLSRRTV